MKLNNRTLIGVGLGLVAGYFIFKSKDNKLYKIGGMGLAGGILATLISNVLVNKDVKKPITLSTKNYIPITEDEMMDEETGNIELQQVPTVMPINQPTSTSQNFDIDLGLPNN